MASAAEAFRAGDIAAAIAAAQAGVKAAPRDAGARWLLAELLLFTGDTERADRMLDAAALDGPSPPVLEFRRLLRAETSRQQLFAEARAPQFQGGDATPAQQAALRALVLSHGGAAAEAATAAAEAEALRATSPGQAVRTDGSAISFDDLRDADDILAPMAEVLTTAGEHMLVPWSRIASLGFDAPRRPRDLAWRRTSITLRDGTQGVVFMPCLYPGSAKLAAALQLGRETAWTDGPGPVRGQGLRLLLLGEDAVALTELRELHFA